MSPSSSWSVSATASHAMAFLLRLSRACARAGSRGPRSSRCGPATAGQAAGGGPGPRTMWPSRTSNCDSCSGQVTTQSTTGPAGQQRARVAAHVVDARRRSRPRGRAAPCGPRRRRPWARGRAGRRSATVFTQRVGPVLLATRLTIAAAALHEVAADEARRRRDGHAGHAERARRAAVPGEPGGQRRALQRRGRAVEQAVEEADPAVLAVAHRPVGHAGDGRGHRRREARRAERARRVQLALGGGVVRRPCRAAASRTRSRSGGRRARGAARARPTARRAAARRRGCRGTGRRRAARRRRRCR